LRFLHGQIATLADEIARRSAMFSGREGQLQHDRTMPTNTLTQTTTGKIPAQEALKLLDQAWTYYVPEPKRLQEQREPELFEYANAA
jgi:hypothetical protein